jgi:hypothetical protein
MRVISEGYGKNSGNSLIFVLTLSRPFCGCNEMKKQQKISSLLSTARAEARFRAKTKILKIGGQR